jgi:hypothetical protein
VEGVSLLKNPFVPFSDSCSGAESAVFGRFEPASRPEIFTQLRGTAILGSSLIQAGAGMGSKAPASQKVFSEISKKDAHPSQIHREFIGCLY